MCRRCQAFWPCRSPAMAVLHCHCMGSHHNLLCPHEGESALLQYPANAALHGISHPLPETRRPIKCKLPCRELSNGCYLKWEQSSMHCCRMQSSHTSSNPSWALLRSASSIYLLRLSAIQLLLVCLLLAASAQHAWRPYTTMCFQGGAMPGMRHILSLAL